MSIIRVRKDARYFAASNEPFNDKRLSWEARGLMGYLLSKPNNWQVKVPDLERQGPAREYKVRRMLAELRKAGYMNRIRLTGKDGTFDWLTEVFESPSLNPKPASYGFSTSGSTTSGKLPDIVITDSPNTESQEEGGVPAGVAESYRRNLFSLYEKEIGVITPIIADSIQDWEKLVPEKWIADAIAEAAKANARSWRFVEAILKRWKAQGNQEDLRKPARASGKRATRQEPPPRQQTMTPEQVAEMFRKDGLIP